MLEVDNDLALVNRANRITKQAIANSELLNTDPNVGDNWPNTTLGSQLKLSWRQTDQAAADNAETTDGRGSIIREHPLYPRHPWPIFFHHR